MDATERNLRAARTVLVALIMSTVGLSTLPAHAAVGDSSAGSSLPAAGSCPPATPQPPGSLPGIDVSHWQGAIDWTQVAASGQRFVFAKATEGTAFVDPEYATYRAGAAATGLAFGAYHFARPDLHPDGAVQEADHFVDVAQPAPGDLIPVLDIERMGDLTQDQMTEWILAWLGEVTARTGVRPMVYTSPAGWNARTGDTTAVVDAGYVALWVAHWTDATSPTVPAQDWGGHGWTFWQYSDCGSIPGIAGNVDTDWYAGTAFDTVTIPTTTPDTVVPVATPTPPTALDGSLEVSFSERVRDVTSVNVGIREADTGAVVPGSLTCTSGTGADVDCASGRVRAALVQPDAPLVPGRSYVAFVNPPNVAPWVVDRAGNAAASTELPFTSSPEVEQSSAAVTYGWRTAANRRAYGGSYAVERLAGARATFEFPGRSVTWYTVRGPAQGRAAVSIDGVSQGTFDQWASKPSFHVARTFRGLERGTHTITVRVLGRSDRAATDTQVAIDAFLSAGRRTATPDLLTTWHGLKVPTASGGSVASADLARASATMSFFGTGADWYSVRGPDQGRATIFVDGAEIRTVDGYAPQPEPGVVRSIGGLAPGLHTLRIVVLGESRRAATGSAVTIDRFAVAP